MAFEIGQELGLEDRYRDNASLVTIFLTMNPTQTNQPIQCGLDTFAMRFSNTLVMFGWRSIPVAAKVFQRSISRSVDAKLVIPVML